MDLRTRKDRIQQRVDAWQSQIPHLADQYLKWKEGGLPNESKGAVWTMDTISFSCEKFSTVEVVTSDGTIIRSEVSRILS